MPLTSIFCIETMSRPLFDGILAASNVHISCEKRYSKTFRKIFSLNSAVVASVKLENFSSSYEFLSVCKIHVHITFWRSVESKFGFILFLKKNVKKGFWMVQELFRNFYNRRSYFPKNFVSHFRNFFRPTSYVSIYKLVFHLVFGQSTVAIYVLHLKKITSS